MKQTNRPPSLFLAIEDEYAGYCLDGAVVTLGTIIENALLEREDIGTPEKPETKPRYTLTQLLDADFRLPRPESKHAQKRQTGAQLRSMAGKGLRMWKG